MISVTFLGNKGTSHNGKIVLVWANLLKSSLHHISLRAVLSFANVLTTEKLTACVGAG